jgi:hypothetical protein
MSLTGWVSVGGLLLSAFALWRTGRVRVLDLRLTVRKTIAELSVELEHLSERLEYGVQSRTRVAAASGEGGGNVEIFRQAADADRAELQALRSTLEKLNRLPPLAFYSHIEDRAVGAQRIRTRLTQLSEKYAAALREDDARRARIRDRMDAAVNRAILR